MPCDLIVRAYSTTPLQIRGGTGWIEAERYDISATVDPSVTKPAQTLVMLQTLLTDRFKLALHHETEVAAAYVLVVGKNGPKLKESTTKEPPRMSRGAGGQRTFEKVLMSGFADLLSNLLVTSVKNETGLTGYYDVKLELASELTEPKEQTEAQVSRPPSDAAIDSIFTSVEALGLKLERRREPAMIVIDHAERPSEN